MSDDSRIHGPLELRGVSKRFMAGAGSCSVAVTALRAASMEIRGGEIVVVAGPRGSGKTTLLLCAAGLLACDSGEIRGGSRRVIYRDLLLPARTIAPLGRGSVLFLDSCDSLGELPRLRAIRVINDALAVGAAVVLAAREAECCLELAPPSATISVVHLRLGETTPQHLGAPIVHRVAEASGSGY
jgi:energy-coupling factor transporter ATP-binding protein EcfA2